jgi:tetratricopeptide (TPR) repeat protein
MRQESARSYTGEFDSNAKRSDSLPQVLARLTAQTVEDVATRISARDGSLTVTLANATWGAGASEINLGNEAAERGDWMTAREHYRRALAKDPDSDAAMYNLGLACEATGDLAQATEWFVRASGEKGKDVYRLAAQRTREAERESLLALTRAQRWSQQMASQPLGGHSQQPYVGAQQPYAGALPAAPIGGPGFAAYQQPPFGGTADPTAQVRRLPAVW